VSQKIIGLIISSTKQHLTVNELLGKEHDCVAVVTHSGVQRLLHAHVLDTPMSKMFRLHLNFGAVMEIESQRQHDLLTIRHL